MTSSEHFAIIDQITKILAGFPGHIQRIESKADSRAVDALLRAQVNLAMARSILIDQDAGNAHS